MWPSAHASKSRSAAAPASYGMAAISHRRLSHADCGWCHRTSAKNSRHASCRRQAAAPADGRLSEVGEQRSRMQLAVLEVRRDVRCGVQVGAVTVGVVGVETALAELLPLPSGRRLPGSRKHQPVGRRFVGPWLGVRAQPLRPDGRRGRSSPAVREPGPKVRGEDSVRSALPVAEPAGCHGVRRSGGSEADIAVGECGGNPVVAPPTVRGAFGGDMNRVAPTSAATRGTTSVGLPWRTTSEPAPLAKRPVECLQAAPQVGPQDWPRTGPELGSNTNSGTTAPSAAG